MSIFSKTAFEVYSNLKTSAVDRDAEWQRVNTYISDLLKEVHMTYSKFTRLQLDFVGHELSELEEMGENILSIGETLSHFAKAFYEGKLQMAETSVSYGGEPGEHPVNPVREESKEESEQVSPQSYDIPVTEEDETAFEMPAENEKIPKKKEKSEAA